MNQTFTDGFDMGVHSGAPSRTSKSISRKRQLEAAVILDMISIDRQDALNVLNAWRSYLVQGPGTRSAIEFNSFDEWLP